ncbi:sulfite exporter TauE/SafE family protein [Streptomyces sp. NPDC089799]|uniref:sulfite exporter TauE/SafE family protein n=1 Tax=Streptomyces sp. NPDC089799 TaxID=3155066 RepID=UPI0034471833
MSSSVALLITGAGTGLFAGGASCAAVQGGLLAGAVTRLRNPEEGARAPLAPVGAFLAGKLASHALLGALLGAFGSALQPGPRVQAGLLLAAGALMVLFALDLFGVKAAGRLVPRPPAALGRVLRRSARTRSVGTPALIGFATALVPCGVTLSMELLAVTSGSPVAGAAVMAGFVVGTAPLFGLLGYLFRRGSQALSGQLAGLTGVVVLAVAAWTMASALQAGGWVAFDSPDRRPTATGPFTVEGVEGGAPASEDPASEDPANPAGPAGSSGSADGSGSLPAPVRTDANGRQIVTLTVTDFYAPTRFTARSGVPTTLVLHGKDSGGCARAFTIPALGVQEIVKRDGDTEVDLGTPGPGTLRFTCAMGMQTGAIDFGKGRS